MTVVTALAVSWKPLMNSKAKATSRAMARKSSGPAGSERAASQKFIHVSWASSGEVFHKVIRRGGRWHAEPARLQQIFTSPAAESPAGMRVATEVTGQSTTATVLPDSSSTERFRYDPQHRNDDPLGQDSLRACRLAPRVAIADRADRLPGTGLQPLMSLAQEEV